MSHFNKANFHKSLAVQLKSTSYSLECWFIDHIITRFCISMDILMGLSSIVYYKLLKVFMNAKSYHIICKQIWKPELKFRTNHDSTSGLLQNGYELSRVTILHYFFYLLPLYARKINLSPPEQNGGKITDDKCNFIKDNWLVLIISWLKSVP